MNLIIDASFIYLGCIRKNAYWSIAFDFFLDIGATPADFKSCENIDCSKQ